jgi:hypothetical protein
MIGSLLPSGELGRAETATRLDFVGGGLPGVHVGLYLRVVHQFEMLAKMILPVKGTFLHSLLLTGSVVV